MNRYYFFVIIPALTWSTMGLLVRNLSISGLEVFFFAALISASIFAIILARERKLKKYFLKKHIWLPVAIGLTGSINNVTYFFAFQLTTIANATFVHYLAPVLVVLLSPFILKQKSNRRMWISAMISLIGLFILLDLARTGMNLFSPGIVLAFISAIGYAGGIMVVKKASEYYSPKELIFSQMFFSVIILFPFIAYINPKIILSDVVPLVTLGAVHQGVIVLMFYAALSKLKPQNVSIITYLEPVGAVILAIFFLKEYPPLYTLFGGALILLASYLTVRK